MMSSGQSFGIGYSDGRDDRIQNHSADLSQQREDMLHRGDPRRLVQAYIQGYKSGWISEDLARRSASSMSKAQNRRKNFIPIVPMAISGVVAGASWEGVKAAARSSDRRDNHAVGAAAAAATRRRNFDPATALVEGLAAGAGVGIMHEVIGRMGSRKKNPLTPEKARQILRDGQARGYPLTDKQRRYLGAVASGRNWKGNPISTPIAAAALVGAYALMPKGHAGKRRRNSDEEMRALERAAALGDPQAQAKLHAMRDRIAPPGTTPSRYTPDPRFTHASLSGEPDTLCGKDILVSTKMARTRRDVTCPACKTVYEELTNPPSRRRNSDEEMRKLERAAALGDPQAQAKLARIQGRIGDFDSALRAFLTFAQNQLTDYMQKSYPAYPANMKPILSMESGKRYVRIVKSEGAGDGHRSAWAFVDKTTGGILKPASWKAPAKHERGNIYRSHEWVQWISPYGPAYLKNPDECRAQNPGPAMASLLLVGNGTGKPIGRRQAVRNPSGKDFQVQLPQDRVKGTVTLAEARKRWPGQVKFGEAAFKDFHRGSSKVSDDVILYDDGKKEVTVGWTAGTSPEITYSGSVSEVPKGSIKSDALYVHKTGEDTGRPTYLVGIVPPKARRNNKSPVTTDFMLIGNMTSKRGWLRD